jgi:purine-binding chemotaxis protein CheW
METPMKPRVDGLDRLSDDPRSAVDDESRQLVSFRVGNEEFGLEIQRVQEIIRHQSLTRVPNSPDFVEGVINLRGKVIPIIALRKRFGVDYKPQDTETRIVVLEVGDMVLGFIVDSVPQVLRVPINSIVEPPRIFEGRREYVTGVAKLQDRLLILLDVDRVLQSGEAAAAARQGG